MKKKRFVSLILASCMLFQTFLALPAAAAPVSVSTSSGYDEDEPNSESTATSVQPTTANLKLAERKIFEYLVLELGINNAAAAGVLANIQAESSFRVDALGDNGTSYGICQWHNGRWTALKQFCPNSWKTLTGQLRFLKHELNTGYVRTLNALQSVPNTSAGAYKAAYYWCVLFEMPDHMHQRGKTRGQIAVNTFWPSYRTYGGGV